MHVYACVCVYMCVCVCEYTFIYIYIYMYIYDSSTWHTTFPLAQQCITRKSQTLYSWHDSFTSETYGRTRRIHVVKFGLKLRIYDTTPSRSTERDGMTPSHPTHSVKCEGVVSSNSVSNSVYTTNLLEIWLNLTTRLLHIRHIRSNTKDSCREIQSQTPYIRQNSFTFDQMWRHDSFAFDALCHMWRCRVVKFGLIFRIYDTSSWNLTGFDDTTSSHVVEKEGVMW